ncbi:MAG: hypothetical protein IPL40_02470 [Proteobacteria bacterium]|nr:hypothetical protein [Pseudomonadota bacterium]
MSNADAHDGQAGGGPSSAIPPASASGSGGGGGGGSGGGSGGDSGGGGGGGGGGGEGGSRGANGRRHRRDQNRSRAGAVPGSAELSTATGGASDDKPEAAGAVPVGARPPPTAPRGPRPAPRREARPEARQDGRPEARRGAPRAANRQARPQPARRDSAPEREGQRPAPVSRGTEGRPAPDQRPTPGRDRGPGGPGGTPGRRRSRSGRTAAAPAFPADESWDLEDTDGAASPRGAASGAGSGRRQDLGDDDTPLSAVKESGRFAYASPREHEGADLLAAAGGDTAELLPGRLCRLVAVQVGVTRVVSELDAGELTLEPGQRVMIEGDRSTLHGTVVRAPRRALVGTLPLRVLRVVGDEGAAAATRKAALEHEAVRCCRERIKQYGLPMKVARVEVLQNGSKAIFHFAAESRIDFRDLVRDLSRDLHLRVELRQVGVRDESKLTGGLGPCGRELCCSSWINDFAPVSIRMAKDQNLVLNPAKISGMCGRLKCCLAYEQSMYRDARRRLPRVGETVQTPDGLARVNELDLPRLRVRATLADGSAQTYAAHELSRSGRGPEGPEASGERQDS